MPASPEYRIAVGSPAGGRSTTWKFFVNKNDVYIVSGMFENNCKISLHESGDCQFSGTATWVLAEPGRRNADRHFKKWHLPRPSGNAATHVLRMLMPGDDLVAFTADEDPTSIHWLPAPSPGYAVLIDCHLTRPSELDPTTGLSLPFSRLFALQLSDLRWFVVLHGQIPNDKAFLQKMRLQILAGAEAGGVVLAPTYRTCATGQLDEGARTFIELRPLCEAPNQATARRAVHP
jgi:hypothetical protein